MRAKKKRLPKIYSLDYLSKEELTEDDLHNIFDRESLLYSLIKEMHVDCNEFTSFEHIYDKIRSNKNWMNERHFQTSYAQENFIKKAERCIKNAYQYGDAQSKRWVESFMTQYGFPLHKNQKFKQ